MANDDGDACAASYGRDDVDDDAAALDSGEYDGGIV